MHKSTKAKIVGGATAILMSAGLAVAGSSVTSAYFSDTNTGGAITADFGTIAVDVDGNKDKTPNIDLGHLLPGEERSGTFIVKNTGNSKQDVHLAFPKSDELWFINQLGTFATVEITVDGTQVFFSDNLNGKVNPLPKQLLLKGNVDAGAEAEVEYSFTYATKATTQYKGTMSLHYDVIATQHGIAPGA